MQISKVNREKIIEDLADDWEEWIGIDAANMMKEVSYYSIEPEVLEKKNPKFKNTRVIALNT